MRPTRQTSIAQLPYDLPDAIREAARHAERLRARGGSAFGASVQFSWFENDALLSCRVSVENDTVRAEGPPLAAVTISITEEDGNRNLMTAQAFGRTWVAVEDLWNGSMRMNNEGDAQFVLPLDVLLAR